MVKIYLNKQSQKQNTLQYFLFTLAFLFFVNVGWGQIIISQYIETNSGTNPKGIELWNVSGSTIDFSSSNLDVKKGTNGGAPSSDFTLTSGTLADGEVIVIGTSDLSPDHEKSFTFNGDDALEIWLGGTKTDVFGNPGSDPGSSWSGNGVSTANQNIQLKTGISSGDTDGWTDPSGRFETVSTDPSGAGGMDGFGTAPSGGSSGSITLSESSINFENVYAGNNSRVQTYTVEGSGLAGDITITPPTGYEVSTSCTSGYGSSLTLTESSGSVAETTIYARFSPSSTGTFSGNISHTDGSETENISVNETNSSTNKPGSYYSSATSTGQTLKWELHEIINGHEERTYTNLWTDFQDTDPKPNGNVWDMYSDKGGCLDPPYEFIFVTDQCGIYSNEGDCYNREHSFPQGWWGGSSGDDDTVYTDLFHLYPTDGKVNGDRGSWEFGVVASPTNTYQNGSKKGSNSYSGSPGATAFEPIDEYKGDLARSYFYLAARYADRISNWTTSPMIDGDISDSDGSVFEEWALNMLIEWHTNDPVSQKELNRNDEIYSIQGNRNPFIDNPDFVDDIWGTPTVDPEPDNHPTGFSASAASSSQIDLSWTDAIGSNLPDGYLIKANETGTFTAPSDGTDPAEDTGLSDGSALVKVAHGSKGSHSFTGLSASTTYYFKIWPYANSGSNIAFKTDGTVPTGNATTDAGGGTPTCEDFNTGLASSYTTGTQTLSSGDWYTADVFQETSDDSYGSSGHAARLNDDTPGASLRTPALNTVGNVTFYYRELNSGGGTFSLQKSTNGTDFTEITTQTFSGNTFTEFSYDINDDSNPIYIRIENDDQAGHLIIDEFCWTSYSGSSNDSDADVTSITQPSATTISSLDDTQGEAEDVFKFRISDGGSADGLATKVTNIRIKPHSTNTADWTDHIQGVTLENGSPITIGSPTITDTYIDIPIASSNLDITDGGNDDITMAVYLNTSNIVDGDVLSFMIDADDHGFSADASGTGFASTFSGGDFNSNDFTVAVTATELAFVQQPTNTEAGASMSPSVTVEATDANGNRDTDYTSNIQVSSTGTLTGTTVSVAAASGLATFGSLTHTEVGTGFTLTAKQTSTNDWDVTSDAFDIKGNSESGIIAVSPSESDYVSSIENTTGPLAHDEGVQVWKFTIRDGGDTNDDDDLETIVNAITFTTYAGNTMTDWFDAIQSADLFNGTTRVASATITENQLQFSASPIISVPDDDEITLSLRISINGTKLDETNNADKDKFRFQISQGNVTADASGSGFSAFTAIQSDNDKNVFEVVVTELAFVQQPTDVSINTVMSPSPTVEATDANGNRDLDYDGAGNEISLTTSGTFDATATKTVQASSGVSTFNNILFSAAGSGVTISTTNTNGLLNTTSDVFDIIESINSEDFTDCGSLTWTAYDVAGDDAWTCGSGYIEMNGYGGTTDEDWLISPSLNLDAYSDEVLTFETAKDYSGPDLELYYSTDYDGSSDPSIQGTWNSLSFTKASNLTFTGSGDIDLSAIIGTSVYVAFKYTATGSGGGDAELWRVDNISITGTSSACTAPTTQALFDAFTGIAGTQFDVNWARGDGENVIIVAREGSAVTFEPADNTTYSANASFGSGTDVGTDEYVVYNGDLETVTVTSLSANTTYHFAAFEYNCTGGDEVYLTPGDATSQGTINYINTSAIAGSPFCVTSSATDNVTVDFTYATGSSFGSCTCTFTAQLSDETGNFASPISLGTVSSDETGSQSIFGTIPAGITSGTAYRIRVVSDVPDITGADNGSDLEIVLGPANVVAGTPSEENSQVVLNWTNPATCFDEILVVASEASISATPSGDGSSYTADPIYGDGTDIGTNEYVVYKGTAETETVTSLTNDTEYYFKIFTRKGTEWSSGVEFTATPVGLTVLEYGDLAIVAVNTAQPSGDEISFVAFKTISTNTAIDFTDNGYERVSASLWGDTEGTLRFTRTGANIPAGTVITFVGQDGGATPTLGTDFDIYINGSNDNANWDLASLNGSYSFNMNANDQVWIMQNGTWTAGAGSHDATYDGNILYGWTATGWEESPNYASTSGSTKHEQAECSITDVYGATNQDKVKYTGPTDACTKIEWIGRINNADNWTDYADNTAFNDGLPKYRVDGATFSITAGTIDEGKWAGYKDSAWCDCSNWMHLEVPTVLTDVTISSEAVNPVYLSAHVDSLAECNNLTIDSRNIIYGKDGASLTVNGDLTISEGQLNFTGTATTLTAYGDISIDADTAIMDGTVELAATGAQSVDLTSETDLTLENFTPKGSGTKSFSTNIESLTLTGDMNIEGSAVFDPLYTDFLLDIQGDWTSYGEGGFTETGVTLSFSGTTQQTISTSGGESFVDLWISNSTADGVALGSDLTISGELDLGTDGVFKPGATARTITLTANGAASNSLKGSGTATIDLSGAAHTLNIACESPGFTGTLTSGTTSIVNYNRSGNQSIMDDATIDYANLTLSGSGIKDIDSDLEIVGNLLLDNVTFNASAGSQTLLIEGNLTMETSSSMTNTLTNLDLWLDGTNNQVIRGNGSDFYFNDITSFKSAGNITLSNTGGTSNLISNNDIAIDLSGGNLTDNGNTLEAGDDIEIGGGGTITLTGTLELNGSNVDGDMHLSAEDGISKFPAAINSLTVGTAAFELYPTGGAETFDINGSVVIENGATFDANGNNLNVGGNWTTHGNAGFSETGVDVTFDGSSDQTITSGDSEVFEDLIVNKPGGNLILANDVSTGTLTLTNGLVETEAHKITVTSTAENAISGHGTGAYVYGNLVRYVSAVNTYDFPIGTASNYEEATIVLNTFTGGNSITGNFSTTDPGYSNNVTVNGTLINQTLDAGYWTFEDDGATSLDYDITLISRGHSTAGAGADYHAILKNDGSGWQSEGNHNNSDQEFVSASGVKAVRSDLTSFSDFLIGFGNGSLPIELLEFKAELKQHHVILNWTTASELNNDFFTVNRSIDAKNFAPIGKIMGSGTSNAMNEYSFIDNSPVKGTNYYQLQQTDYDGKNSFSEMIAVEFKENNGLELQIIDKKSIVEAIINNPCKEKPVVLEVFDVTGKKIYSLPISMEQEMQKVSISKDIFHKGIYMFNLRSDKSRAFKKIVF